MFNWASHPDYFTITVPGNLSVSGVYISVNKPNVWAWIGDTSYGNQLAWAQNPSSGDLLSQWGLTSIGPGTYGMYLENHDQQPVTSVASYRLDFISHSIPEPSSLALLLTATPVLAVALSAHRAPPGQSPSNPTPLVGGTPGKPLLKEQI